MNYTTTLHYYTEDYYNALLHCTSLLHRTTTIYYTAPPTRGDRAYTTVENGKRASIGIGFSVQRENSTKHIYILSISFIDSRFGN